MLPIYFTIAPTSCTGQVCAKCEVIRVVARSIVHCVLAFLLFKGFDYCAWCDVSSPGGTCAKVTHFGVGTTEGAKVHPGCTADE